MKDDAWIKVPKKKRCHLTKLSILERHEELEFQKKWEEEIEKIKKEEEK